ncbi:hypothetical protein [Mastigocladopsis repens]|uniref:hypothetical protein n=1 Tax=Mastigocladopsis repens TaxID=221287 RepID=UPI0002F59BF0|nr:hypothetical protein [Mastigocladopsis repens]
MPDSDSDRKYQLLINKFEIQLEKAVKQDNKQQISDFVVIGRDDRDQSYLILQYKVTQIREAQVCWCYANQPITVGEVVRGKLLPPNNPKEIWDELLTLQHQADSLPTLLVE